MSRIPVVLVALLAWADLAWAGVLTGPILDQGVKVGLEDLRALPPTFPAPPYARVNVVRAPPDGSGRLFVGDLNGPLSVIEAGLLQTYMDLAVEIPSLKISPGIACGFVSFSFHPEFGSNGLFYTVHTEPVGPTPANLGPAIPTTIEQHSVLTEWTASDPAANAFSGTSRELIRVAALHQDHNLGEVAFNPHAGVTDEDYGLLYIAAGDFGSVHSGEPDQLQRLDTPYGAIMRIDPLGGPFVRDAITYEYGIPPSNPYANDGDPATLGEIYAYGFRHAHRLSWDPDGSGTLFVSDIGQGNIEEVNILHPAANYGWPEREGTFALDVDVDPETVLPLPPDDATFGYTYPVAQYDHDEGLAIAGGFAYRGLAVLQLFGRFVFGDIVNGRIFYAELADLLAADDGDPGTTAQIYELHLVHDGQEKTLLQVVNSELPGSGSRTDLRFGVNAAGELFVTTKRDGFLRKLVPPPKPVSTACSLGPEAALLLAPILAFRRTGRRRHGRRV